MKLINIITALILSALIVLAFINLPAKSYQIHKTRSGDFILVDDAKGGPRIYELIELQTDRVLLP
jgi:hypothetical protein